ncbi:MULTISPECIES: O-antigen ligase family protein [unclassified Methylobacterium]|uniref:O-antigen ligase family protein n=1 Tax=unclassified Methylobacterium TaxID=2615210 RepID=UPI0011C98462|nr:MULTISPECIES: O-antigen ligase [unclassified Methylobacterium]TXN48595.1 O-antigen ligase family protein [Methylobacterium sp. WL7]TXN68223.1 O-antigen ligase family protein [Methylobacterium sp. WL18]
MASADAAIGIPAGTAQDGVAGRDLPDVVRVLLNGAVFVLLWNHDWLKDLSDRSSLAASEDGSLLTQVLFLAAGLGMAAALHRIGFRHLRPLATWPLMLCGAWLGLTALLSVEPSLSLRRLALLGIATMLSAGVLLVARSPRQLALTMAWSALVILVASYLAVALVPDLAIHSAFDVNSDPSHPGLWRGIFPQKNEAGAAMVILVIVGLYVAAAASRVLGWIIVLLALGFLVASGSKTAILLLPVILAVTGLCRILTGRGLRALLLLGPIAGFSLVSIGSILVPAIQDAVGTLLTDATFTGRSEIWQFALDNIMVRPWRGWGIGAFWMTERTMYGGSEELTWVNTANHSHNAYLDTALIGGFPFLALTVVAFVLAPVRDLQRVAGGRGLDAETLLFLRLWFLGLVSASFETVLYNGNNATCCMFMMAVFGLRLRTRYALAG